MTLVISLQDTLELDEIVTLYHANGWSDAAKPDVLMAALRNSHSVVTARIAGKPVGLGNALSDGYLVVYYPHLLVHPDFQGQGIGRQLMERMQQQYTGLHQQILTADGDPVGFYNHFGFKRAGVTEPMWIYAGNDH